MCAIVGLFGTAPNATAIVGDALSLLRHRGPDDSGVYIDDAAPLVLGHNRLSIIDLSMAARQPMRDFDSGDVLVFNGEIYNFREIRKTLEETGVIFKTRSDTEVLLKAFSKWGSESLTRLKGMYAFAFWRQSEQTLYLVRDPVGVKPLYYRVDQNERLFFASEIKAFRALDDFAASVDQIALGQFLEFGYTFEPERTIFRDVKKLGPGEMLICQREKKPRIVTYRSDTTRATGSTNREPILEELHNTLDTVVSQHLVADVPVGLLLSGGIDSSIVAALAAKRSNLRTLTMAFGESSIDERAEARRVAQQIGAESEEIVVHPNELTSDIAGIASTFDDIFGDWGTVSTRVLYKKARERGIKVVLTGEGADEIFGGYPVFLSGASRLPADVWLFGLYRRYAGRRYGGQFGRFRRVMHHYLRETCGERFNAIRLFELRSQLPNNYIMKVDKASMSVGVEARVPYLDQRVVELAMRMRARDLIHGGSNKRPLREMAVRFGLLPEDVAFRPKFGASIAASWMDEQPAFRNYAREIVLARGGWAEELRLDRAMRDYFVFERNGYPFPSAISVFRNLAWRLLLLELWSRSMGVRAELG